MALTNTTQYANRMGMDLKFFKYGTEIEDGVTQPDLTVDFANEIKVELSGGNTWATGGKKHANKIAFSDPMEGTITISTQLMTTAMLGVIAGKDLTQLKDNEIIFNNNDETQFWVITGDTIWKDIGSAKVPEKIKAYKASPQKAYNITYNGSGDPTSMDIVFDLAEDDDGNVFSTKKEEG